jgi:hypothetical protein
MYKTWVPIKLYLWTLKWEFHTVFVWHKILFFWIFPLLFKVNPGSWLELACELQFADSYRSVPHPAATFFWWCWGSKRVHVYYADTLSLSHIFVPIQISCCRGKDSNRAMSHHLISLGHQVFWTDRSLKILGVISIPGVVSAFINCEELKCIYSYIHASVYIHSGKI